MAASQPTSALKTTKRNRLFAKDTFDVFATLIVSLELSTNRQFFRTFPHSFVTDDAVRNLARLRFTQSNRGPDPKDPSRIVTTTTTTTFTMTRDTAKAICQYFMDASLIENAADPRSNLFKERGVYTLTPKGLHVLDRFVTDNGIAADNLQQVFSSQPILPKMVHLERTAEDDEIIFSRGVVTALFRRFVGRRPNYPPEHEDADTYVRLAERVRGIWLGDYVDRAAGGGDNAAVHRCCFNAVGALSWLCDFTAINSREEAAEVCAQFNRFGLIELVSDKRKNSDSAVIVSVTGTESGEKDGFPTPTGEFCVSGKAIYRVTEEGRRVAKWDQPEGARGSTTTDGSGRTSEGFAGATQASKGAKIERRISRLDKPPSGADAEKKATQQESNTHRLRYIIEEPQLRALFREFLSDHLCEENLAFYLDVSDFKRTFGKTSTAMAANAPSGKEKEKDKDKTGSKQQPSSQTMSEQHHEHLVQTALGVYNTYLAPSSSRELNIDYTLRNDVNAMRDMLIKLLGSDLRKTDKKQAHLVSPTLLRNMIRLYERIQDHVFRLMATDSVPKFVKTPEFRALLVKLDEDDEGWLADASGAALDSASGTTIGEAGGTYVTISQRAIAREQKVPRSSGGDRIS
ncbi:regulator of G protein signaling superfamily [Obba rivulosa]|uniref:Regulator of G protein signaling superfamily n=1 Tax=Obba rivulosa TaxID=1052685 RepID=A0A8E2AHZ8_9APHY|nr:regulator of G protein signaling superfamily [Obba rivulosa]